MAIRVFLVEDMKHVHGALADLLSEVGEFPIVHATGTEAEARLWLAENPDAWDLAIVDLVLDQGTGMSVIPHAHAAARHGGGKVVVFSDYASDGIRRHCQKLGADAVFLKSQVRDLMHYCSELDGLQAASAA